MGNSISAMHLPFTQARTFVDLYGIKGCWNKLVFIIQPLQCSGVGAACSEKGEGARRRESEQCARGRVALSVCACAPSFYTQHW